MAKQQIILGSVQNTVGKLVSRTAGQMNKILLANKIKNVTGKLRRTVNPKVKKGATELTINYSFPFYSKFIDNYQIYLGTGVSKKWIIKSGRLSKIPSNYKNPLRSMTKLLVDEVEELTVDSVNAMILKMKNEFKNIK